MTTDVRPFPWALLAPVRAADAARARGFLEGVRAHLDLPLLARVAEDLLGSALRVEPPRVRHPGGRPSSPGVQVVLRRSDEGADDERVTLQVEWALAERVVAHALKRPHPPVRRRPAGTDADEAVAGSFAAVLAAALRRGRRSGAGGLWVVDDVVTHASDTLATEMSDLSTLVLALVVLLGDDAYGAQLTVPSRSARADEAPWTREALVGLGDLPLTLSVVRVSSVAPLAEVAALDVGDLWLPGVPSSSSGPVTLVAPRGEAGVAATLGEDGRLVVGAQGVTSSWHAPENGDDGVVIPDNETSPPADGTALTEALGDAPVVVRVELGAVEMTARQWAALGVGDVLSTGQRLGEPAVLRVGGVPVARGELVDVDGELAVRILERLPKGAR